MDGWMDCYGSIMVVGGGIVIVVGVDSKALFVIDLNDISAHYYS